MSDEQRDAAVIDRRPLRYADLRAITELRSFSAEETILLVRVANAGANLIEAQHREIDRLTAERDQAREQLAKLRAACDMVATSLEANLGYGTGKPYFWSGVEGRKIVQHTLRNAANNLRAALGIESEADHD